MATESNNQKASPVTDIAISNTPIQEFIGRWENSGAAERANYVLFLSELCTVLELERPNPQTSDPARDAYREFRKLQHALRLAGAQYARVPHAGVEAHAQATRALWAQVFGAAGEAPG